MTRPQTIAPIIIICAFLAGCQQTYLPPAIANPAANLVVEGFINNGNDSTIFNLSRTFALTGNPTRVPEPNATITIQGSDSSSYPLGNAGNGRYGAILPALNPNANYHVLIAAGGKQYSSDFEPLVSNPPIDSISWVKNGTGVQVYANTHDPTGNARYFRWEYEETWEFHSAYFATLQYVNDSLENYSPNKIDSCWKYDTSTSILLSSTIHNSPDVVYDMPLVLIPLNSQQISVEYSILVRQYALSREASAWWQVLQNNTENIGSIFGVMPTGNPGNIHCLTDTTEMVVGYVSAGTVRSQRIFISAEQVSPWFYVTGCKEMYVLAYEAGYWYSVYWRPINYESFPGYINISTAPCIDCTLSGSNIRPTYWQ
jgi:hypothetical protein